MDDSPAVSGVESVQNRVRVFQGLICGDGTADRGSLDQLHNQIIRTDVVEVADVGMIQCRYGARLALEPIRELLRRNLDRDLTPQPRIARFPHLPHPAFAQARDDLIRAEFVACGKRHVAMLLSLADVAT
jgi:hypothetical protein